jgi:hypothetical protein
MGKTKELLMKELSKDKETNQQKFAVFQNRIFKKEGYVSALENLLKVSKAQADKAETTEIERARLWVQIFEVEDKLNAQRQVLSQHRLYLNELKRLDNEQNL